MIEAEYRARLERLCRKLRDQGLGALLVFDPKNIRYLSGFTGEDACLVASTEEAILVSDSRFRLQASEEAPGIRFYEARDRLSDAVANLVAELKAPIGVESSFLTLRDWLVLEERLRHCGTELSPVAGIVEELRLVKSRYEQDRLRAAGELVASTMARLLEIKVAGRTEAEVALDLEVWARRHGSGEMPFSLIVAAGPRGAMPHAVASSVPIPKNTLMVVDIGVSLDGYASDMTRTFATGNVTDFERTMHDVVRVAQEMACQRIASGVRCADVDAVARSYIEDHNFKGRFEHGLGHGVGLDVHEAPRLGPRSEDVLTEGMVVTVEPGVYIEGVGGVRIEDTVLVGASGPEVLTEFPRDLLTLG